MLVYEILKLDNVFNNILHMFFQGHKSHERLILHFLAKYKLQDEDT
jgi:hypothetical protein